MHQPATSQTLSFRATSQTRHWRATPLAISRILQSIFLLFISFVVFLFLFGIFQPFHELLHLLQKMGFALNNVKFEHLKSVTLVTISDYVGGAQTEVIFHVISNGFFSMLRAKEGLSKDISNSAHDPPSFKTQMPY